MMARNPSHFGSNTNAPVSGSSGVSFASIGAIGGAIANGAGLCAEVGAGFFLCAVLRRGFWVAMCRSFVPTFRAGCRIRLANDMNDIKAVGIVNAQPILHALIDRP